jgi:hypothetical protein
MNEPQEKKAWGRPVKDPSGPARNMGISLAPRHQEILIREAEARGISRSELVARLLDRLVGVKK